MTAIVRAQIRGSLISGALACATFATASGAQKPVERDSAGIRIIENPSRATAPVIFRLGTPTIDIGGPADNPDDEFSAKNVGALGAFRFADATFVVPDIVRLQFFDAQGHRTGIVGRDGSGPSEFRSLSQVEFCLTRGDTMIAGDYRNGRFAVIHQRRVVKTTSYLNFGSGLSGCFDDGTALMQGGWFDSSRPTYTIPLRRVNLDGKILNDFGELVFRRPSAVTHLVVPTIRARGQFAYAGDGATSEVRVYRADGHLTRIVRTADVPKKITAADVERETRGSHWGELATRWPDTYPAYARFMVDPDGRLWVEDFNIQLADKTGWTCLDANGRLVGRLEIPRVMDKHGVLVVAFGANEVQISRSDDDGFRHLTFYPLVRTRQ